MGCQTAPYGRLEPRKPILSGLWRHRTSGPVPAAVGAILYTPLLGTGADSRPRSRSHCGSRDARAEWSARVLVALHWYLRLYYPRLAGSPRTGRSCGAACAAAYGAVADAAGAAPRAARRGIRIMRDSAAGVGAASRRTPAARQSPTRRQAPSGPAGPPPPRRRLPPPARAHLVPSRSAGRRRG